MALHTPKKSLLIIGAGLIVMILSAVTYLYTTSATQNEPEEFRGMTWGTELRDLQGMKMLAEDGEIRFYQKDGDPLKMGSANVSKIIYGFHKGRFYSVMVYFDAPANFAAIKDQFTKEYGEPMQPEPNAKKCFWNGDNITMLLTFDDAANAGRIAYFFKPIQLEAELSRPGAAQ